MSAVNMFEQFWFFPFYWKSILILII